MKAAISNQEQYAGCGSHYSLTPRIYIAQVLQSRSGVQCKERNFGTGVFRNDVEVVAKVWAALLIGSEARYTRSFDRVVSMLLGNAWNQAPYCEGSEVRHTHHAAERGPESKWNWFVHPVGVVVD